MVREKKKVALTLDALDMELMRDAGISHIRVSPLDEKHAILITAVCVERKLFEPLIEASKSK